MNEEKCRIRFYCRIYSVFFFGVGSSFEQLWSLLPRHVSLDVYQIRCCYWLLLQFATICLRFFLWKKEERNEASYPTTDFVPVIKCVEFEWIDGRNAFRLVASEIKRDFLTPRFTYTQSDPVVVVATVVRAVESVVMTTQRWRPFRCRQSASVSLNRRLNVVFY